MSVKILSITLLLLSVHLCCHTSAARRHISKSRPCCVGVTVQDMSAKVVGDTYRVQDASHPCVNAIIFNTDDGRICTDPEAQWVKNLIATMTKV